MADCGHLVLTHRVRSEPTWETPGEVGVPPLGHGVGVMLGVKEQGIIVLVVTVQALRTAVEKYPYIYGNAYDRDLTYAALNGLSYLVYEFKGEL